jgi:imidazole glycerol-phosphate synthase subunit HisH
MKPLIAVIDYEMGNLHSVTKALEKSGARVKLTSSAADIRKASGVVLPGVGAFGEAVKHLQKLKLLKPLRDVLDSKKPFLGICLGLQLLFERSDESPNVKGLGHFKGRVVKFKYSLGSSLKVPHMGWNTVIRGPAGRTACLKGLASNAYFYFVHSFFPVPQDPRLVATRTSYGRDFCSSIATESLFASQFHPEKSGSAGLKLLKNFVHEVARCS